MMDSLISVIIPVYNLEDYIENCLKSVTAQTYPNLEIICVDDGSSDNSAGVIEAMAEKDGRIRLIRQDNAGVSAARNVGVRNSRGEYLIFVDGDDYIHRQTVEILLDCILKEDCDIVCAFEKVTERLDEDMPEIRDWKAVKTEYKALFSYNNSSVLGKSACAKIYRRSFAVKTEFPEDITNGEDGYYIISLLSMDATVAIVNERLYYYYNRPDSTVTSAFSVKKFSITKSFDRICDNLRDSDNEFLKSYSLQYLYQTIFYNRTLAVGTPDEAYVKSECRRYGKKWMKPFLKNRGIKLRIKTVFVIFFYSRRFYELARMIQDPTMRDFYRNRNKEG
ncbi:MAG: glycosyltransferase family 2 protein [Clostridia bacterium]|nr:glycosyltransferase family 2 protein [Clostridia bacterium]